MLFILLICIIAFAGLIYAVMGSNQGGGKSASDEKAQLTQAQTDNCNAQVDNAVLRLKTIKGCSDEEISYESAAGHNVNPDAPADKHCHIFDPAGAGASPCGPYLAELPCDKTVLAVGEAGCGVVYAGTSGGKRLYVMNTEVDTSDDKTWGPSGINENATSNTDGAANTDVLAALGSSYEAATYCRNLGADWYLPSPQELWDTRTPGASYMPQSQIVWTSKRMTTTNGTAQFYMAGTPAGGSAGTALTKTAPWHVKCVRSD